MKSSPELIVDPVQELADGRLLGREHGAHGLEAVEGRGQVGVLLLGAADRPDVGDEHWSAGSRRPGSGR